MCVAVILMCEVICTHTHTEREREYMYEYNFLLLHYIYIYVFTLHPREQQEIDRAGRDSMRFQWRIHECVFVEAQ